MENEQADENGKITAEKAMKMLKSEGLDLTLEQSGKVLELLRKMANIAVSNYLRKKRGN
jgi:hypothetical protein